MSTGDQADTKQFDTFETMKQERPRSVAVTGATGVIGADLVERLRAAGRSVIRLVRDVPKSTITEAQWDAERGLVNPSRLEGVYGVIHLAGESIAGGRWTEAKKRRIRDSRVKGTEVLCNNLAALHRKPEVLVCASATGFYGDRGDTVLDEQSAPGAGFLPEVCKAWEQATAPAVEAGIRVVNVRTGIVLSRRGGALKEMLTPFKLGVGGKIGSGRQYWSWISHEDIVGVFLYALDSPSLAGPVNAVAPQAVTNATFTKILGEVLHRPTILPMPAFVARLALGEMANDLLLASAQVVPRRLQDAGYQFQFPDLRECLKHELGGDKHD